jgi:hypothetical protein
LNDIQPAVSRDVLRRAMSSGAGVFVDAIMLTLGGPAIRSAVAPFAKTGAQQFLVSRSISAAAKARLKEEARFDADKFLSAAP